MSENSRFKFKNLAESFLQDWTIKIICLVLAFVIFMFYRRSTLGRRFFSANLTIENSNELVAASSYPRTVKVTLWGDALNISSIKEDDIEVYLDLNSYSGPGIFKVPVRKRITGTALNIEPLDIKIEPSEIELLLEESASKRVPVDLSLKGTSARSFEVSETTVDPAIIEIKGPRSLVEKVESISTEAILLENRNTSFSGRAALINNSPLLTISGTGKVDYWIKIVEKIITKDFNNLPVKIINLSSDLELLSTPTTISVSVSGKENIVENFQVGENFVTLDCSSITSPGEYNLKVSVATGNDIKLSSVFPDTIAVVVGLNQELLNASEPESETQDIVDDSNLLE